MRFDVSTPEGNCEFSRHGFTHIPAMMFIDAKGNLVETTDSVIEKEDLQKKYDALLKR
ncbi:MAG: hypothetical protein WC828_03965 [Thermoleophilia bacterium]|jgi:hypothetical protein